MRRDGHDYLPALVFLRLFHLIDPPSWIIWNHSHTTFNSVETTKAEDHIRFGYEQALRTAFDRENVEKVKVSKAVTESAPGGDTCSQPGALFRIPALEQATVVACFQLQRASMHMQRAMQPVARCRAREKSAMTCVRDRAHLLFFPKTHTAHAYNTAFAEKKGPLSCTRGVQYKWSETDLVRTLAVASVAKGSFVGVEVTSRSNLLLGS